jgi:hypothetical protein
MDETVIENPDVLGALRSREEARIELSTLRRQYGESHEKALAEIARLDLDVGEVVRIGEFRIERKIRPGRSVSFETEEKASISISRDEE